MAMRDITAERVREVLVYDPETGIFIWRIRPAYCIRVGTVAGSVSERDGYVRIQIDRHIHFAHVLAWLWMTGEHQEADLDHRNGARSDNRWTNLRPATRAQNMQNANAPMKNNALGIRGVSKVTGSRTYTASIQHNGRVLRLGNFDTTEEAGAAYQAAKARLHPFCER